MFAMKKIILVALLIASATAARALEAGVSYCVFRSETGAYVELYLYVDGASVEFVAGPDSSLQAGVEVVLYFKQQDQIVRYDKFALLSPRMRQPEHFMDIKRYALPDGDYELTTELRDLNRTGNEKTYQSPLSVRMSGNDLLQSGIQLLAAARPDTSQNPFCKNGIYMEPLARHIYGKTASELIFYHEIYHSDLALADDFLVTYRVETATADAPRTVLIAHKRRSPAPVVPLLLPMDISSLPNGDYRLVVEIRNRAQELKSRQESAFRRENPYLRSAALHPDSVRIEDEFVEKLSTDELRLSLRALTPQLAGKEQEALHLLIKSDSLKAQKSYLFRYWIQKNANAPEAAYRQYMKVVMAVDQTFASGFRRGFETDRGHIYLKYGPPDDMETREQEPSAPPYEVWSYNQFPATKQNNVRFIFYNPSLAPGDFVLLHSDAIGERQNPQWLRDLYRNAPGDWDSDPINGNDIRDGFNRNAKRVLRDN
jgi:GWxTD domain-containing protein